MIKRLLLILFMPALALATAGPKLKHPEATTQREFEDVYHAITYPDITYGTASTMTITNLLVGGNPGYTLLYSSTAYDASGSSSTVTTTFVPSRTTVTLTPHSANSRIEVSWNGCLATTIANVGDAAATIFRGSTNLASGTNSLCVIDAGSAIGLSVTCAGDVFDLPNTTSATTYSVQFKTQNAASAAVWNAGSLACIGAITVKEWGYY
jgi:hypothetical protein